MNTIEANCYFYGSFAVTVQEKEWKKWKVGLTPDQKSVKCMREKKEIEDVMRTTSKQLSMKSNVTGRKLNPETGQ